MKNIITLIIMGLTLGCAGVEAPLIWDGDRYGMELLTIGHKQVTILLNDGRTAVVGVPILVERQSAYQKSLNELKDRSQKLTEKIDAMAASTSNAVPLN